MATHYSWGSCDPSGTIDSGSGDWAVTHVGTGRYRFTNAAWPAKLCPVALGSHNKATGALQLLSGYTVGAGFFYVVTYDQADTLQDAYVFFRAYWTA